MLLTVRGAERSRAIRADLLRLQDTTAQIRVRGAVVLLIAFAAIAEQLGLEVILGAFAAGAILTLVDHDEVMTHPELRRKLEAMGFGGPVIPGDRPRAAAGAASRPSRRMGPLESAAPRPFRRRTRAGSLRAPPDERGPRVARQPESQATPRRSTSQRSLGRTVSTVP